MSNISAIANNYYSTLFETQNTTLSKSSTSINDANDSDDLLLALLLNNENIQSNLDGDTFQLTSSTSADNGNISYDFKSGSSDPIRSFLDKVKDGTVTSDDLEV